MHARAIGHMLKRSDFLPGTPANIRLKMASKQVSMLSNQDKLLLAGFDQRAAAAAEGIIGCSKCRLKGCKDCRDL